MHKRDLTFLQMFNLSFGFFGVQIAYALQSANISRIFATLGADPHQLSFFWILPPLMGMLVQPLIGRWSDKTWCRWGRRKPYLLFGAIVAVLVMLLLPNAGSLSFSSRLFLGLNSAMWFGLFSLIFLDTSINVAMQPFKMMVGDMVNEKQKTQAYSIQSFLCNAGSFAGYLFPIFFTWIGIANEAGKGVVPDSVIWSFYVGAAILILCVIYTFLNVKEMNPQEYAEFHGIAEKEPVLGANDNVCHGDIRGTDGYGDGKNVCGGANDMSVCDRGTNAGESDINTDRSGTNADESDINRHGGIGQKQHKEKSESIVSLLLHAPKTFWTVGLVQFFCWAAFLYMWTYTNGSIASTVWGVSDPSSAAYQQAGNWVGVLFAVQAVGSMLWALVIPRFRSRRAAYIVSLAVGAAGFISIFFIHDQYVLAGSFLLIGAAWAAMLSLPFTILTNSLSGEHMGEYLGLFNCTICLPQIIAAATGGLVLRLLGGEQVGMMMMAGAFLLLGALSVLLVKEKN